MPSEGLRLVPHLLRNLLAWFRVGRQDGNEAAFVGFPTLDSSAPLFEGFVHTLGFLVAHECVRSQHIHMQRYDVNVPELLHKHLYFTAAHTLRNGLAAHLPQSLFFRRSLRGRQEGLRDRSGDGGAGASRHLRHGRGGVRSRSGRRGCRLVLFAQGILLLPRVYHHLQRAVGNQHGVIEGLAGLGASLLPLQVPLDVELLVAVPVGRRHRLIHQLPVDSAPEHVRNRDVRIDFDLDRNGRLMRRSRRRRKHGLVNGRRNGLGNGGWLNVLELARRHGENIRCLCGSKNLLGGLPCNLPGVFKALLFVGLLRPPFAVVVGVDAEAPVDGEAIGDRRLRDLDAVLFVHHPEETEAFAGPRCVVYDLDVIHLSELLEEGCEALRSTLVAQVRQETLALVHQPLAISIVLNGGHGIKKDQRQ
mmetsp:Transcript_21279/g.39957  ORF Transcript_21279/g.39957 Transcript_21279/m.39957 type:complete len:418 (-) Transcript_21279:296-1549(-)